MVGAEPRLPASETKPTNRNDRTTPATAANMPCHPPMPKPSTNDPYDTPNTEMFDAHQGQNRSCGWPCRSLSSMTLMPLRSMANVDEPAPVNGTAADGAELSVVMACLPLPR